jgi:quercetin dioxygenase-like cupin family protein
MALPALPQALAIVFAAACAAYAPALLAQVPGVAPKPLLKAPVSGDDTREATVMALEFAPGAAMPRHTHPGDEYATVIEGTLEIRQAGQEPRRVSAGQSFHNPRGIVHEARNVGDGFARLVITFVVEKNLPLTSLVPVP